MLASLLTTVLLVSSVLAAPSPQPGYKQTSREAVTKRLASRANGVARRQAVSPRVYSRCFDSTVEAGQGPVFARVTNVNFTPQGNNAIGTYPGMDQADCTNICATNPDTCQAIVYFDGPGQEQCRGYAGYSQLGGEGFDFAFASTDCASLASLYPGVLQLLCSASGTGGAAAVDAANALR